MCKEGWSGYKVWGARGRIETLAGAYFGHWYLSFSVISSLPRLLTTVGVWEAHLQHVLGMCSYLLHSAAMGCNQAPCNKLLVLKKNLPPDLKISKQRGGDDLLTLQIIIFKRKRKIREKNSTITDIL